MKPLFTALTELLADGQYIKLTITKKGTNLTLLAEGDGMIATVNGTAKEFDDEFINIIQQKTTANEFSFKVTKTEKAKEEETEEEEETEPDDSDNKADSKTKSKKPAKKSASKTKSEPKAETIKAQPTAETTEEVEPVVETPEKTDVKAEVVKNDNEFKWLMQDGKRLFSERDYKKAAEQFAKAKELKPENAEADAELQKANKWVKALDNL